MTSTRLIAPQDIAPTFFLTLNEVFLRNPAIDLQPVSDDALKPLLDWCVSPNLGLFWQRYFPAHNSQKRNNFEHPEETWGVDFHDQFMAVSDANYAERKRDTEFQKVENQVTCWSGYGALRFFQQFAQAVLARNSPPVELLNELHARRARCLNALGARKDVEAETLTRTATGIGDPAPFENSGIAFHHTYGFPVLPGASLKGLARHYLAEERPWEPGAGIWGRLCTEWENCFAMPFDETVDFLFGAPATSAHAGAARDTPEPEAPPGEQDGEDAAEEDSRHEGMLVFHDAWPVKADNAWFDVDIITVHHKKYYESNDTPDDTMPLVPIPYLCLAPGVTFRLPVTLSGYGRRQPPALQALALCIGARAIEEALLVWGVGGRSSAGAGLMLSVNVNQGETDQ